MRLDDLYLPDLLDAPAGGGVLSFAGQRTLLLDAVALGLLRQQLLELFGPTTARGILTRFGYTHGWRTAEVMREALRWDDLRDWQRAGGVLHRLQGLVDYRPTPKTDPRNLAEARWLRSYEAEQHLLHLGPAEEAVCWTLAGFASGYLSRAFEREVYCVETSCIGRGDAHCHMIGRDRETWGAEIEPHLPYYEKECLDASLRLLRERIAREEQRLAARRREQDAYVDALGHEVIARSETMQRAVSMAVRIAIVDTTVLLTGESGTGKECVARLIHEHSQRAQGPFLAVNCGALPETLLDSELFGHARGAFTGATANRAGLFEAAAGGTLFLDEVGEVSPATQVKLLRVLQERQVRRVGENTSWPVDVRVIAATNKDLAAEISAGRFREDLYYRLKVVEIPLAPLRERAADVLPLARLFLEQSARRMDRDVTGFTPQVLHRLVEYAWPGNVRELQNAVERGVALAEGSIVQVDDLPGEVQGEVPSRDGPVPHAVAAPRSPESAPLRPLDEVEREHILRVLEAVGGTRAEAARVLGIGTATLYRRLKEYGAN